MSVYTCINSKQLERLLSCYSLGKLLDFQGIAAGIDNSNYALRCTEGDFILTIYESLDFEEVVTYLKLLTSLSHRQFPCPQPQMHRQHNYLHTIADKPAAIFKRIPGACINNPTLSQCWTIGESLGQLHMQSRTIKFHQHNRKGDDWLQHSAALLQAQLTAQEQRLLAEELSFQAETPKLSLPQGIIHADLFRDNVLFEGDQLTGVLDFYSACHDDLLLDLAITINDWSSNTQQGSCAEKQRRIIAGYESKRSLTRHEKSYLPVMLRWAALRFWLSRLGHQSNSLPAALTTQKDPADFKRILEYHRS